MWIANFYISTVTENFCMLIGVSISPICISWHNIKFLYTKWTYKTTAFSVIFNKALKRTAFHLFFLFDSLPHPSLSPSPVRSTASIEGPSVPIHQALHFSLLAGINHKYFIIHHGRLSQGRRNLSALPSLAAQHWSNKLSSLLNKIDTVCKFRYWEFLHRPLLHSDRLGSGEGEAGGWKETKRARKGWGRWGKVAGC